MAASPESVTTAPAPRRAAPAFARVSLRAFLTLMRERLPGAREAVGRMNKLIDAAHLDYPDQ